MHSPSVSSCVFSFVVGIIITYMSQITTSCTLKVLREGTWATLFFQFTVNIHKRTTYINFTHTIMQSRKPWIFQLVYEVVQTLLAAHSPLVSNCVFSSAALVEPLSKLASMRTEYSTAKPACGAVIDWLPLLCITSISASTTFLSVCKVNVYCNG